MARPRKEGLDYFPHDTDALSDEKVEAMRALYANDGYAFYFILLERIYRTPDGELDVSDAETRQILASKVAVTPEKFEEMLKTALKRDVFDREAYENKGILTSEGIQKRRAPVLVKREVMRDQYKNKKVSDAETLPETPQSKAKHRKEKHKSKIPPTRYAITGLPKKAVENLLADLTKGINGSGPSAAVVRTVLVTTLEKLEGFGYVVDTERWKRQLCKLLAGLIADSRKPHIENRDGWLIDAAAVRLVEKLDDLKPTRAERDQAETSP